MDLNKNQALNLVLHTLTGNPSSPVEGQVYHNSANGTPYIYAGGVWYPMISSSTFPGFGTSHSVAAYGDHLHTGVYKELTRGIISEGGSFTLALTDAEKLKPVTSSSTAIVTVPPNSSVAFPIGTQIDLIQCGAGKLTFSPGSGVTINSKGSKYSTNGQNVGVSLVKIAINTWYLLGDLTT